MNIPLTGDNLSSPHSHAATKAEQALEQLMVVAAHLQAAQTIYRLCHMVSAPQAQLNKTLQAIAQYTQFKESPAAHVPTADTAHSSFAERFQELEATGVSHCLVIFPTLLENAHTAFKELRAKATTQKSNVWVQKLDASLTSILHMRTHSVERTFTVADLAELTHTLVPIATEAHTALIDAPALQRKQRDRVWGMAQRRHQVAAAIETAATAITYLTAHSAESPSDSTKDIATARQVLQSVDSTLKNLLELSRPGQTEWITFESEMAKLTKLYKQSHLLCKGIQTRQRHLKNTLNAIAGHLKWLRMDTNKLTAPVLEHGLQDVKAELAELDLRLRQFEAFSASEPHKPWPSPAATEVALRATQKLLKQLERATGLYPGGKTTIQAYCKMRDFAPIDAVLQSLPI